MMNLKLMYDETTVLYLVETLSSLRTLSNFEKGTT